MNPDTHDLNLPDTSANPTAKRMGRPPVWTAELIQQHKDAIIEHMANGRSITSYVQQDGCPSWSELWKWLESDENFKKVFNHAKSLSAHVHADGANHTAEQLRDGKLTPPQARVIMEQQRWYAGVIRPRDYGQRVDHTVEGTVTHVPGWLIDVSDDRQAVTRTSVGALPASDTHGGNDAGDPLDVVGTCSPSRG